MSIQTQSKQTNSQSKPSENVTATKKVCFTFDTCKECHIFQIFVNIQEYEFLWRIFFISVTLVGFLLSIKIYKFQTSVLFKGIAAGSLYQLLIYGIPFAIIYGLLDYSIHFYFDTLCEKYFLNLQKYREEKERKQKSYQLVRWAYAIIYYCLSSIVAIYLLKDSRIWPWYLNGSGSCSRMYEGLPFVGTNNIQEIKIFYILQFGKHFSRAFSHIFIRSQGNFYQYALHHSLSTFLILFSFLVNYWYVGVMILLIHDFSDFSLILSRIYRQIRNRKEWLLQIFYMFSFVSWVGTRILMFTSCCIYPSIVEALRLEEIYTIQQSDIVFFPSWFMVIMLILLEILQLFWTYYILKSFLATNAATKKIGVKHNYD